MPTDLTQATAAELSGLYASGDASPVEALTAVLERAERVNPAINALPLIDAEAALAAAKASASRWAARTPLSPLDGVPVSIKELVRVRGWAHTMASKLTDKTPAPDDAPSAARLREAGAVLFAQSSSPEYGYKGVTDSPLHGVTRNPWDVSKTPGGSSGGAGAAVAAGLGPLAIGTDGGGSVRIPAGFCGLVGLKATFGRVPAWPLSMHGDLANVGPMARTAMDSALMMNVITARDARDPYCLPEDGVDYVQALDTSLRGLRVAWLPRLGDYVVDDQVAEACAAAARRFAEMGCIVEEAKPPFDNTVAGPAWVVHWLSAIQRLLQLYPESRHGEFDPGLLAQAKVGAAFPIQNLVDAMATRRELSTAWNLFFERYDLLITPTLSVLPFAAGQAAPQGPDGKALPQWACTAQFNLTRHPAASAPAGLSREGLPIGLQIVAGHYRDALVLAAAHALGQAAPIAWPALPKAAEEA